MEDVNRDMLAAMFPSARKDKDRREDEATTTATRTQAQPQSSVKVILHKRELYTCPNQAQHWDIRRLVSHLAHQDGLSAALADRIGR